MVVLLESAPHRLDHEHSTLFTPAARQFLEDLCTRFEPRLSAALLARQRRRLDIAADPQWRPQFCNQSAAQPGWRVAELPERLRNRQLDLGDVSPANTVQLRDALYETGVQGIQVDYDDGHCPTWRNTVLGLYNVWATVHGRLAGGPMDVREAPLLMLRPRAFNMVEQNCMINGKKPPAALFDFALLAYHNAHRMHELQIGPYFYLSKIEDSLETALWNDIFLWTQQRVGIPAGIIKACVLIENILATFCMEDILYSLRDHAIGLNCGIWDYAASIISKFGDRGEEFVLPDRQKYVNMGQPFLRDYMTLLVSICHRRGALATGGMAALVLPPGAAADGGAAVEAVRKAKRTEIEAGVDGFMVHDMRLVPAMRELWAESLAAGEVNQVSRVPEYRHITAAQLVELPKGGVTYMGLRKNIAVSLLFIYHWLSGSGVFYFEGAVEDSATAEISRSQIWQWLRFATPLEDEVGDQPAGEQRVTYELVYRQLDDVIKELRRTLSRSMADYKRLVSAKYMLLEIVTAREFVEYLTTYLSESHKFRALHNKNEGLEAKL